jgi:hypothetical protein
MVIDRTRFDDEDRRRFTERLDHSLEVLAELLGRPGFGEGEPSLGAEFMEPGSRARLESRQ